MTPPKRKAPQPVVRTRPNPMAWAKALELAHGDAKRLQTQPDGSVVVRNPSAAR